MESLKMIKSLFITIPFDLKIKTFCENEKKSSEIGW